MAIAEVRAPIFEDKVVDFILELAEVTEKPVSREALFSDEEEEVEEKPGAEKGEKQGKGKRGKT